MHKIVQYRIWHVKMPFKNTMRSSRGIADFGEKVILELITDMGFSGLGEASVIFPSRSGEYGPIIFTALRELFAPKLIGRNPLHLARIMDSLEDLTSEDHAFLSTKAAIDIALHDLKAKILGISVADLLGGAARTKLPLSRSISAMPDEQILSSAQQLVEQGYQLLTIKGTSDWEKNIITFQKLRTALPDNVEIEIDPNQAWQPKEAIAVDQALSPIGLRCIEQPCSWWDLDGMKQVTARATSKIAADESVFSPADVFRVASMRAADMITIKIAKSGGLRNAVTMVECANNSGLSCNLGSKHPMGIGAAAILHFAASIPAAGDFIGYGSALERFIGDVIQEEIHLQNGTALLPSGLGLGVTLDLDRLNYFSLQHFDSEIHK
jgi:L-alanine-DL-glutamate epimerase-like enolase superfamily enzyme